MSVLRLIPLKGEAIVVDADEALVGREASCNVVVSHPSVSRRHALLKRKQDVFFVVDQGSANGTFVDSKRIVDATLKDGCALRFGSATFNVELAEEHAESVAEDELVVAATIMGRQPSFSATVLEGAILQSDDQTPHYGTEAVNPMDRDIAPTVQSEILMPSKALAMPPARPVASVAPHPVPQVSSAPTGQRGPAFWLMLAAGVLALLFVGAALGLVAAFVAKRMGFL